MYLFKSFSDFLLSTWLWGVTFDIGHVIIGSIILYFLLHLVLGKNLLPALFLSISSYVTSFLAFTLLAVGIFRLFVGHSYEPLMAAKEIVSIDAAFACFLVASIYTLLQTVFFALTNKHSAYTLASHITAVILANSAAAAINFAGIRFVMWYAV